MEKIVFTNGCFDILHAGHVDLLERARALGTKLIVGVNSDRSVRAIKGAPRPFNDQTARAQVLRSLKSVDEIFIFDEPTPERLIKEIKPNVLVKGGDWQPDEIVGGDFVRQTGGAVYSLPFNVDVSTTDIVEKILRSAHSQDLNNSDNQKSGNKRPDTVVPDVFEQSLKEHRAIFELLASDEIAAIKRCGEIIYQTLATGKKILLCGNGGSAADAQHLAAEFAGRFEIERRALPAIALTTDTSILTAVGNDYGFERVFARQVEALAQKGDVLIGISTSGNSPNVLAAIMAAREINCQTIGLTGAKGQKLSSICDAAVLVPSARTARIQEAHHTIGHLWCEFVDQNLSKEI